MKPCTHIAAGNKTMLQRQVIEREGRTFGQRPARRRCRGSITTSCGVGGGVGDGGGVGAPTHLESTVGEHGAHEPVSSQLQPVPQTGLL